VIGAALFNAVGSGAASSVPLLLGLTAVYAMLAIVGLVVLERLEANRARPLALFLASLSALALAIIHVSRGHATLVVMPLVSLFVLYGSTMLGALASVVVCLSLGVLTPIGMFSLELAQASAGLRATPDDLELLAYCYTAHAILGEKRPALEDHGRAVRAALAEAVRSDIAGLYALLGERERALQEIARQLRRPGSYPSDYRGDVMLAALWDEPKFIALVNDPASNAPLPFDLRVRADN